MSRSHDYHCPTCHTWTDELAVSMLGSNTCPEDGGIMFYDLNHDGCWGGCDLPTRDDVQVRDGFVEITFGLVVKEQNDE